MVDYVEKKTSEYGAGAAWACPGPGGDCQVGRGRGPKIQPGWRPRRGRGLKVSRGERPRRGKPRAPADPDNYFESF